VADDPFALLGLPAQPGLSDDDVRGAWRRIAAATHPDREDGGDPARFGAAAASYVLLRTSFGRGEALADLAAGQPPARPARRRWRSPSPRGAHRPPDRQSWAGRLRPGAAGSAGLGRGLTLRVLSAAAAAAATVAAAGLTPATIGLVTGALTVTGWALWRRTGWGRG
jgi:curved DNA-binding protein CbpA